MRRFQYTLDTNQQLKFDFDGSEPARVHVEVDDGTIKLTTVIAGHREDSLVPAGRAWTSGPDLRFDIEQVIIERDPDGPSTEPTVTFDIGRDAGQPGVGADLGLTTVKRGALTTGDGSGTITLGGTAEEIAASNLSRRYLFIQNIDAGEDLWISFVGTAVIDGAGSIRLGPYDSFTFEESFVATDAISAIAASTGHKFTLHEG